MSFSTNTKRELARLDIDEPCCRGVALKTLLEMSGTLLEGTRTSIVFGSENPSIARRFYQLSKTMLDCKPVISVSRRKNFKKNNVYSVRINVDPALLDKLESIGIRISGRDFFRISEKQESSFCCLRIFLRYAFLAGGSIINPQRGYHLEIACSREDMANRIVAAMEGFNLRPGTIPRKQLCVVYLKDADQIADFLNIVSAHTAMLKMESIRTIKGMRNKVNRLINCETANINKSINASLKQIENINLIQRTMGLGSLPESLRKIAVLRLENPEASLKELGELMNPPMSKSGVNHKMRKIGEIAEKIYHRDQ